MSYFWPDDLELEDTLSPEEILKEARGDWEARSGGRFTLVFHQAESQSGNAMTVVHAQHEPSRRMSELFTVVHRPDAPYPVAIQPRSERLPDFLKKSYRTLNPSANFLRAGTEFEKEVHNPWVADTPAEFRRKLGDVLTLGTTKSEVVSLAATRPPAADPAGKAEQTPTAPATTN